jgi:hypothetical protein
VTASSFVGVLTEDWSFSCVRSMKIGMFGGGVVGGGAVEVCANKAALFKHMGIDVEFKKVQCQLCWVLTWLC